LSSGFIENYPRVAQVFHGAVLRGDEDLPAFVRVSSTKDVAIAGDWFI
jgi:hypothetical protein